jgi:acetate kinase
MNQRVFLFGRPELPYGALFGDRSIRSREHATWKCLLLNGAASRDPRDRIWRGGERHTQKSSSSLRLWHADAMSVLSINAGSSSIRFAFHGAGEPPAKLLDGRIERIAQGGTSLLVNESENATGPPLRLAVDAADWHSAVAFLMRWLEAHPLFADVQAVGHRVVHGMSHTSPERVTPALLAELKAITPYDPEHLPREIELIETVGRRFPRLPQVACFDTAFHRSMPRVATILPIPRRYQSRGVQRYGFHGLSYTFLLQELARRGDPTAARGRVILAHLGSGASLAAVRDGKSIDTSMGFTPAAGLPMSTRSGDLDPGLVCFLALTEAMDAATFQKMVNHESGLLGLSETSSDIRDLLAREPQDDRAAEAVALFCYQAKKWIGAFTAALGGLDTLVFAGGIGENAASIRTRICDGLEFLGIDLHKQRNAHNAPLISSDASRVAVRVMHTDEESVIAGLTIGALALKVNWDIL